MPASAAHHPAGIKDAGSGSASAARCLCSHSGLATLPTVALSCVEGPAAGNQPFPHQGLLLRWP